MHLTIPGNPITKKNHSRIVTSKKTGSPFIIPSKQWVDYEKKSLIVGAKPDEPIDEPINLACVYYMQTRRKVDLTNLIAGTCDLLVARGVLADDKSDIVASHDGCRVAYDKENPRVEIEIVRAEK